MKKHLKYYYTAIVAFAPLTKILNETLQSVQAIPTYKVYWHYDRRL